MFNSDPPSHTRLRSLVNKAFTPRVVEDLRPRIEALVDELLEDIGRRGAMEVISDYAYPIPITVIAEMLGVPRADRDIFRQWTQKIAVNLDPIRTPEQEATALEAGLRLRGYFSDILRERRKQRGADLISGLIHAQEESDSLSDEEILTMCNLLLIAGHETTVNLIGNGLLALLRHPEQRQRWQQDEGLARTAVEELLRFDSPVQLTGRVALEDLEVDGCTVRKGQAMVLLLGAGNRDPEQFANPEDLDLGREPNPHLSFGAGIHFCLGAPLARLEGQIALDRLVRRFPGMSLTQNEVGWRATVVLRGLKALPVTV